MNKRVSQSVTLVRYTPDPENIIASAARLCYATEDIIISNPALAEMAARFRNKKDEMKSRFQAVNDSGINNKSMEDEKFIDRLRAMGHMSPIEHVSFTFFIDGVSRAFSHQLVRHRLASYSQRSQRYIAEDSFNYIVPPSLEGKTINVDGKQIEASQYFAETMDVIAHRYGKLNDALGRIGEKSNEDARYVLPNACETKIFVTMNARELLHFFGERLCYRAQWEIRNVAEAMREQVVQVSPSIFKKSGPKCISLGRCPEGKLSCGKFEEMKKKYGNSH